MPSAAVMGLKILSALQKERVRQHMSKSELARRLGANRGQFSSLEDGKHMPSFGRLMQWCSALGLTIRIEKETVDHSTQPQATERTAQ